jgi:hypothetical protein
MRELLMQELQELLAPQSVCYAEPPHRAIASLLKHDLFGKPMRALLRIMI